MTGPRRRPQLEGLLHDGETLAQRLRELVERLEEFTAHLDEMGGGERDVENSHAET